VVSQVWEVEVWAGRRRWVIKSALLICVPARIPQVSRFRVVLGLAWVRKVRRREGGRKRGRRGTPDSVVVREGKVYLEVPEEEEEEGGGGRRGDLGGGVGRSKGCFAGRLGDRTEGSFGLGDSGGRRGCSGAGLAIDQSIRSSLAGTEG